MFFEFFFFWLVVALLCEISLSPQLVGSAIVSLFVLIFAAGAALIESGADLFGAMIISIYSSVFVVVSLAYVHFNKYANHSHTTAGSSFSMSTVAAVVAAAALFFSSIGFLGVTGWIAPEWVDYSISVPSRSSMTVAAIHEILYRSYSLDVLLLNVYLFFGLVIATRFILMGRSPASTAALEAIVAGPRTLGAAATPTTARVKVATKLRRQIRRKNSSRVR